MAERYLDIEAIAEARLQLVLEYSAAIAIAATAVREDEQMLGLGVASASFAAPPAGQGSDSKRWGVVGRPDKDVAAVARCLVQCPRDRATHRIPLEVVVVDRNRRVFPAAPIVLEASEHLLLLCVNADHRPTPSFEAPPRATDVLKLLVAMGTGVAGQFLVVDS